MDPIRNNMGLPLDAGAAGHCVYRLGGEGKVSLMEFIRNNMGLPLQALSPEVPYLSFG